MSVLSVTLSRLRDDIPQQRRRLAEKVGREAVHYGSAIVYG